MTGEREEVAFDIPIRDYSAARVRYVSGSYRWDDREEMTGDIYQLRDAVASYAKRNGWRVIGFVPIQYGRTASDE